MISLVSIFLFKGRKSLNQFPKLNTSGFDFSEDMASGYSTQSKKTQMGGAKNVLRIRVTKDELWLTTNIFFAFIAGRFDLLHKIPIQSIISVNPERKNIRIKFKLSGQIKEVIIISKRQQELIKLLNDKMTDIKSTH